MSTQTVKHSDRIAFSNAIKAECRTLGHALSMIEKVKDAKDKNGNPLPNIIFAMVKELRKDSDKYKTFSENCPLTKNGYFTPWLVLGYLKEIANSVQPAKVEKKK